MRVFVSLNSAGSTTDAALFLLTKMTDLHNLLYTSTREIPTLSYTLGPELRVHLSSGNSSHRPLKGVLPTERERQLTTARTNQTTALTNGRATNWAPEVEFSRFRALSRRQMTFAFCC